MTAEAPQSVEVRSGRIWRPLGMGDAAPSIDEAQLFEFRHLEPGSVVSVGPVRVTADAAGHANLRLYDFDALRGHLGLVAVWVGTVCVGEVNVQPGKMSADAYRVLRADLDRVWAGLVTGSGPAFLAARSSNPSELWRRLEPSVRSIIADPRSNTVRVPALKRLERVRRPQELTHQMLVSHSIDRPGRSSTLAIVPTTSEHARVGDTLRRLAAAAGRDPSHTHLVGPILHLARHPMFECRSHSAAIPYGTKMDRRYREIETVRRELIGASVRPTEGPGELRLGIRAMHRLYEYWVYLQILLAARARYGEPLEPGFSVLARPLAADRMRLELPRGTTVTFPGPVHVAFEPEILVNGRGWMGLELVPHPDPEVKMQHVISPDVVVYRPGPDPEIQIYDAKYVARSMVDLEAVRLHAKYARVREHGVPAVRTVLAVHPHRGLSSAWAGYGNLTMCPGDSPPSLALPDVHADAPLDPAHSLGAMVGPSLRSDSHDASQTPDEIYPTAVVADQYWMHRVLGDRRIDLAGLVTAVTEDPSAPRFMVAPDIAQLRGFLGAAADRGWVIEYVEAGNQAAYHNAIVRIVAHLVDDGQIVGVVSGDEALLVRLDDEVTHSWGVFSELAAVPDAAPRFLGRP